eukprot:gene12344-15521_t
MRTTLAWPWEWQQHHHPAIKLFHIVSICGPPNSMLTTSSIALGFSMNIPPCLQTLHMCSNACGPLTACGQPRHGLGSSNGGTPPSKLSHAYAAAPYKHSENLGCYGLGMQHESITPWHPNSSHVHMLRAPSTACGHLGHGIGMQHEHHTAIQLLTCAYAAAPYSNADNLAWPCDAA